MKIKMFLIADYASVDSASGKMNVLGVFDKISAAEFPTRHHRLAVVAKIAADPLENTNEETLKIVLVDADGTEYLQWSSNFSIKRDEKGERPDANFILELNNLEFPKPGFYEFRLDVDDANLGVAPLELIQQRN